MKSYMEKWAAEVHRINTDNGWYDGEPRSYGAGIALIHSEISEALEAYRVWGLADVTQQECAVHSGKVYVASELADVLIRILDQCNRHDALEGQLVDFPSLEALAADLPPAPEDFPSMLASLHYMIARSSSPREWLVGVLRLMFALGMQPEEEVQRKLDYNETRGYRHGGKIV